MMAIRRQLIDLIFVGPKECQQWPNLMLQDLDQMCQKRTLK